MYRNNRNLLIISLIALVNALGYGIIIPVLYSYSQKFGMTDFQNGLLFSVFSICQFISTPVIGRLSDIYGRRPLLIVSIFGTAASFFMMAFAPSAIFLFLARALDGITSGNIPVASAVISDTTKPQDRAKGFGIIGASFGFGFVFGPAVAGFTHQFGDGVPFILAGIVSLVAAIATYLFLPETLKAGNKIKNEPLFDLRGLVRAITDERVGIILLSSFIYALGFSLFIYAYQPVAVKVLHLTATQISINFTLFGLVGLVSQIAIIPRVSKFFGEQKTAILSLFALTATFTMFFFVSSFFSLMVVSLLHALANSFVGPLVQTMLSKSVDPQSQGEIQGINQSYVSFGMIVGPFFGGVIATFMIPLPFLAGGILVFMAAIMLMANQHRYKPIHV